MNITFFWFFLSCYINKYLDLHPSPCNSHHQDYYILHRLPGGGIDPINKHFAPKLSSNLRFQASSPSFVQQWTLAAPRALGLRATVQLKRQFPHDLRLFDAWKKVPNILSQRVIKPSQTEPYLKEGSTLPPRLMLAKKNYYYYYYYYYFYFYFYFYFYYYFYFYFYFYFSTYHVFFCAAPTML